MRKKKKSIIFNRILEAFHKGAVYIFCDECHRTTLHFPLKGRRDRMIATMDRKVVALKLRFRCKECGNVVRFEEKKV